MSCCHILTSAIGWRRFSRPAQLVATAAVYFCEWAVVYELVRLGLEMVEKLKDDVPRR